MEDLERKLDKLQDRKSKILRMLVKTIITSFEPSTAAFRVLKFDDEKGKFVPRYIIPNYSRANLTRIDCPFYFGPDGEYVTGDAVEIADLLNELKNPLKRAGTYDFCVRCNNLYALLNDKYRKLSG